MQVDEGRPEASGVLRIGWWKKVMCFLFEYPPIRQPRSRITKEDVIRLVRVELFLDGGSGGRERRGERGKEEVKHEMERGYMIRRRRDGRRVSEERKEI